MEIIQDLIKTNQIVLKKTMLAYKSSLLLFLLGIPYMALTFSAGVLASWLGFLGGILIFAVEAAIISDYLHIIHQVITRRRFDLDDFKNGFMIHFRKVYMILFLFWVANYGASLLLMPILNALGLGFVLMAIYGFVVIILNPLPEMIYQRHYSESEMLLKSVEFSKENVISWFVPNAVLAAVILLVNLLINNLLQPFGSSWLNLLVMSTVTAGLISFAMIYRGYLFEILYKTTRRKRMFMDGMYRN
jgi:hypothetical protein